jgi:hypothetical protein
MFSKFLSLFKAGGYQELTTLGQIVVAVSQTFTVDKFVDGQSGRDAAINALITELQAQLSNSVTSNQTSSG